jgi:predicted GTPase
MQGSIMANQEPPDLSARQLRAVLAVAECRSFIAAAASLKISQPALTRTIQQVDRSRLRPPVENLRRWRSASSMTCSSV